MRVVYYNQKKERFIQKKRKVLLFIVAGVMAVWSFFWLPYFKIKEIEINDPLVSKREVEEELGLSLSSITRLFLPQNNFFLFPSKVAEEAILESGLGVAEVEKKFPNKISVEFKEIKPKFLYCDKFSKVEPPYGGSTSIDCYYIDKNGIPYEIAPFFSESPLPVLEFISKKELKLGEEFLPKNETDFILEFQKEIKKLKLEIKKIEIEKDVKLFTNEGWYLMMILKENPPAGGPKKVTEKLSILFERKIKNRSRLEYIDMRFPNKAYFKLK